MFADAENVAAKNLLADVYTHLGYGAENGTWRNFYLQGAYELRSGIDALAVAVAGSPEMIAALTIEQLFDSLAIRVNGPKAWDESLVIDWVFTDLGHTHRMELTNGVLIQHVDPAGGAAGLTVTLTKAQLLGLLGGAGLDTVSTSGDPALIGRLLAVLDEAIPSFPIVTP